MHIEENLPLPDLTMSRTNVWGPTHIFLNTFMWSNDTKIQNSFQVLENNKEREHIIDNCAVSWFYFSIALIP
jgi:hypothetical protein